MASGATGLSRSLRARLSLWLVLAVAAVAGLAGVWSYKSTASEADELQDDTLRQVAALIGQRPDLVPALATRATDGDRDSNLVVQRVGARRTSGVALPLPAGLAAGFHTLDAEGVSYRVYVRVLTDGERLAVAQQTDLRDEISRDSALRSLTPLLLLMPLLALVVGVLVRRMIAPVQALSEDVRRRSEHELQPLRAGAVPSEIRPFVEAVNGLFARLREAADSQRRFIADAAHELRSPLTALQLQAQRLGDVPLPEPAPQRLRSLQDGLRRARHLLDQLLGYSRAQVEQAALPPAISLDGVCRTVFEDLLPVAEAKAIDLGMLPGDDDVNAAASEADLTAIVRNLIDNAVRYAPAGGRVDVRVSHSTGEAVLDVIDNGPGIAPADRARVLEPFVRLPGAQGIGSGLGLSIVRATVQRLGGTLTLSSAPNLSDGLHVRVALPLAAPKDAGSPSVPTRPGTLE